MSQSRKAKEFERIQKIVKLNRIAKLDAKRLALWYFKETGTNHQSCMCSETQRSDILRIGKEYFNSIQNKESTSDNESDK